ncbi:MAG: NAD(P)/FAD-dependent oxidoreductase [Alphaproteobacteria bacterium]|nr:NAD(P)/FAD-dependent oxidoreductase [Alphaproteobacteria bacterium]
MLQMKRYDVLVIGARCAGAATAMLMARRGLRVLAVDRGGYGEDTLSTHALMRGAVLQLHRWGLLPRLQALGTPPVRRTTFHYGDEAVAVDIRPSDGVDALYAPRRTILDSVLVDAACEAGVEIRHHHSLAALVRDGERVRGAVIMDERQQPLRIEAGLVVGADGVGSTVARLVDAPMTRQAAHTSSVLYGYWSGLAAQGYHWHYRDGASVGVIETNAAQHCVFAAVPPSRFRGDLLRDPVAGYHRVLREVSPALGEAVEAATPASRIWPFAGRKGFFRRATGPGWALVGDAGYFKDPITAHGITDALRDAELLADAAAAGTEAALARYAALRDELSLPLFEATDAIASFDWDMPTLERLHKALNQAMKHEVAQLLARGEPPVVSPVECVRTASPPALHAGGL